MKSFYTHFMKMLGLLCLALLPATKAWSLTASELQLITAASQLSTGDLVVLATGTEDGNNQGVTGQSGSNATVSYTMSDWIQYQVTVKTEDNTTSFTLYDATANEGKGSYVASPSSSSNEFKYNETTGGDCSVNSNGDLCCNSKYLYKNSNGSSIYYRFYATKLQTDGSYTSKYTPFRVYKVVSSTPTPTETYTVSFSDGTTSITEETAGAGITLPEATAQAGYKFIGWATTEGATVADAGTAGSTYHPTANCTLYAVYAKLYTVTITAPENGTLVVTYNGTEVESGAQFLAGDVLDITATPNEGYTFSNWQAKYTEDDTSKTSTNTKTFTWTMKECDVTLTANFKAVPQYTVMYVVNGEEAQTESLYEGTVPTYVPTLETSWTFVGWTEDDEYEASATMPTLFTSGVTEDVILYAVWSKTTGGGSAQATLTNVDGDLDEISTSYVKVNNSFAEATYTNASGEWTYYKVMKAGNQGGDDKYYYQLATDGYIKLPELAGNITSIVLGSVHNGSSAKYTSDLYFCSDKSKGDNDANVIASQTNLQVYGDDVTITVLSNCTTGYILGGSSACRIATITVNYTSGTTTYTLTPTDATPTTDVEVSFNEDGYCTLYYGDRDLQLPEGVEAYIYAIGTTVDDVAELTATKMFSGDDATLSETWGNVVPAGYPVVLYNTEGTTGTATLTAGTTELTAEDLNSVDDYKNDLRGKDEAGTNDDTDIYPCILAYWTPTDGTPTLGFWRVSNTYELAAHKAYLAMPSTLPIRGFALELGGTATAIATAPTAAAANQNVYNLAGQRVARATKGVYIQGGKKVIK